MQGLYLSMPPSWPEVQVILLLNSKWFNCFLFHSKYNRKFSLAWPRLLSNVISPHSFPCYLYSKSVLLTMFCISPVRNLPWASAWNNLHEYPYGWLPSFIQISGQKSTASVFPWPPCLKYNHSLSAHSAFFFLAVTTITWEICKNNIKIFFCLYKNIKSTQIGTMILIVHSIVVSNNIF